MADEGRRRSRVLGWIFGVLAATLAAATVLLYWVLRRPVPWTSRDPDTPAPVGEPPAQPPSSSDGCEVNCNDPCDAACEQVIDGTCGSVNDSCTSSSDACNDAGSSCDGMGSACDGMSSGCDGASAGCDSGSTACNSTVASGQLLVDSVALQIPWLSVRARVTLPAWVGVGVIRIYQRFVSHRLGTRCRYEPSCSEYGVHALRRFGALDGAMVALARIRRCRPEVPPSTPDPLPLP
ncbi:membrane protein insertion efficiency factor YidD, partial [Allorhizocola rhizosphaerae]|uniref:membrane protein insertion efficiency factor YidD n=1 Tax=Allorhizocola rhizosphaerae TaxID=1872709 RepID=UPI001B8BC7DD